MEYVHIPASLKISSNKDAENLLAEDRIEAPNNIFGGML